MKTNEMELIAQLKSNAVEAFDRLIEQYVGDWRVESEDKSIISTLHS